VQSPVNFLVAFMAGAFSFVSPCVLPLFPSYLSFITGMSFDELTATESRSLKPAITNSIMFIFGFSVVFTAMGASIGSLGGMFLDHRKIIQTAGGVLIIFFGLYIVGVFKLTFLGRYIQPQIERKPAGVLGSTLVGAAFAIGWTPCVGPILGSILALAASAGEMKTGIALLLSYSLGLGIPFLLSAIAMDRFLALSKRFRSAVHFIHVGAGVLLTIAGILLVTGYMSVLNQYALRLTPQWLWQLL
jgi:cytochrome c-type biogenesis protein